MSYGQIPRRPPYIDRQARLERARAILKSAGGLAPTELCDTIVSDVFTLMTEDFARLYANATGHVIAPQYISGLKNDILATLKVVALANTPNRSQDQ